MSSPIPDAPTSTARPEPFNWVVEAKIQGLVNKAYERARQDVKERLAAIYSDHWNRGVVKTGITLRASIEAIEQLASGLIANLLPKVLQTCQDKKAFEVVSESIGQYLEFLDHEVEGVARKIAYEIQEMRKVGSLTQSARLLWIEKRAGLLEQLDLHRSQFVVRTATPAVSDDSENQAGGPSAEEAQPEGSCNRCRHWEALSEGRKSQVGLCRRFALAPSFDGWSLTEAVDCCEEWAQAEQEHREDAREHVERRTTAPRVRAAFPALLRLPSGDRSVHLVDLSEEGARLHVDYPPPVGALAILKRDSFEIYCNVTWANESACGVTFDRPITSTLVFELAGQSAQSPVPVANPTRIAPGKKRSRQLAF